MPRSDDSTIRPQDLGIGRLFESVRDAVIVAEAGSGRIILWNPAATKIFGYSHSEALSGLRVEALVPEHLKAQHRAGISRYRDTGHGPYIDSNEVLDLPAVRKTGEEIRIELSLSPIGPVDGSGAADDRLVLAIVRDVTERNRAEEEVRRLNEDLERRVEERTARLEAALAEQRSSEQTLRESEERFRLLVEGAQDYAIFMLDPKGAIASWNAGAERLLGYREEEALGRSFYIIYTPEDQWQRVPERELRAAAEEGRAHDERWHVRKDGTRLWASGVTTPLLDESGGLRGFAKVLRDFTERRKAEEALRMSEARFRAMIEQSPLSIQILSPDGRILRVNRAWEKLWGVTLEDIEGYNLLEDRQLVEKGIMPYLRRGFAGEPTTIPPILYDPEETISGVTSHEEPKRWVRAFVYPVKDEAGNVREVVLIHEDVTERKRAEEALRESEERLRLATESAGLGTWELDFLTGKLKWDNRTKALFGLSSEVEVDYETFLTGLHPEDRERVDGVVRDSLDPGKGGRYDIEYRTVGIEDGIQRWVRAVGRVFFDEEGRAVRFLGAVLDITERKQAEEAMREMREAERRRLARDLHDGVLQDLSYTSAAMGLLKRKVEGKELQEELQRIVDAVRRAAQGLRDAVDELRLEEDHDRPFPELLESLVQKNRVLARGSYEINLEVGEGFPSSPLGKTGTELLGILQEALTNVRRHSGAKNVWVTLKAQGSELIAEVLDDGRGFGPETAPGVGLSSMHERAAVVGGRLKIESAAGRGTRVRLRVPAPRKG